MPRVDGLERLLDMSSFDFGRVSLSLDCCAVMRVLTTQMGLVVRTVALPAMAPAIMDSIVVSFLDAREERTAARS